MEIYPGLTQFEIVLAIACIVVFIIGFCQFMWLATTKQH